MLAGIVIIAFKNWQVSAILLVNDLILDFYRYIWTVQYKEKQIGTLKIADYVLK